MPWATGDPAWKHVVELSGATPGGGGGGEGAGRPTRLGSSGNASVSCCTGLELHVINLYTSTWACACRAARSVPAPAVGAGRKAHANRRARRAHAQPAPRAYGR